MENNSIDNEKKAKFGTANFLIELESKRAIKVSDCYIVAEKLSRKVCSYTCLKCENYRYLGRVHFLVWELHSSLEFVSLFFLQHLTWQLMISGIR